MEVEPSHRHGRHHAHHHHGGGGGSIVAEEADEAEVERLLSERLVEGFVLLEKACPACATPLVKRHNDNSFDEYNNHKSSGRKQLEPGGGIVSDDSDDGIPEPPSSSQAAAAAALSFEAPTGPLAGVPFCVWCRAHVVTDSREVALLESAEHTKVRGSIMVSMSKESNGPKQQANGGTLMTVVKGSNKNVSEKIQNRLSTTDPVGGSSDRSASSKENEASKASSRRKGRTSDPPADSTSLAMPVSSAHNKKSDIGRNREAYEVSDYQNSLKADDAGDSSSLSLSSRLRKNRVETTASGTTAMDKKKTEHIKAETVLLLEEDDGDDEKYEIVTVQSPHDTVNRVESLLQSIDNSGGNGDSGTDTGDESKEEIEVVHVSDESECSDIERRVLKLNSTAGTATAERLVVLEDSSDDDSLNNSSNNRSRSVLSAPNNTASRKSARSKTSSKKSVSKSNPETSANAAMSYEERYATNKAC